MDLSKDRLDVCLRWSEPQRLNEEEAFFVAYDDNSGIDVLLSGLLEERAWSGSRLARTLLWPGA